MINRILSNLLITLLLVAWTAGCSSLGVPPVSDASLSGNPDSMWDDGQKSVKDGEALIAKGEERVEEGRKLIRESQPRINEANDDVQKARRDYQDAVRKTGGSTTPKEVAKESARLKKIELNLDLPFISGGRCLRCFLYCLSFSTSAQARRAFCNDYHNSFCPV